MDVIFAPASGAGKAGVAVIRMSGPGCGEALDRLVGARPAPRRASVRRIRGPDVQEPHAQGPDGVLDEALVLWMPGPGSFTGEDVAELHLHGSRAVLRAVLSVLSAIPGCRLAKPGEFARRAFRNGKRDLAALEGLADLIDAETETQRRQALIQMDGALGRRVAVWSDRLLALQAALEAELDFSDESDVVTDAAAARDEAAALAEDMAQALVATPAAERLREGFRVVIAGPPNAGKSSLLNALARRDVAIVTEIAGTTRDALDVHLDIAGLPVTLTDTAGLRESNDPVERAGIGRAQARIREADLTLWLTTDGALPAPAAGHALIVASQRDRFASDPSPAWSDHAISIVTGVGMDGLTAAIAERAQAGLAGGDSALVVRARHAEAIGDAVSALRRAALAAAAELVAEELRLARRALGRIVGATDVEDVLDAIFGRFCIGK